jgi:pyridoxamine 5'-phosphate oxidase
MTAQAPWRIPLARALHLNRSLPYARYFQLATVRSDGRPANRTVVFRGFVPETNQLTIISDRRSQKTEQIQQQSWAEICWYFPKTREQFRLSGSLFVVDSRSTNAEHQQLFHQTWKNLSDSAREQFYWPTPGQPHDPNLEISTPQSDVERPAETFTLLVFDPTEVDHLDLRQHPHARCRYWNYEQGWQSETVNP